jgi:muramidase (phage lysozyme)
MNARTLRMWSFLLTLGGAFPARLLTAFNSRWSRKPECKWLNLTKQTRYEFSVMTCLLVGVASAQIGFAKPRARVQKLAIKYSRNQSLKESDGIQIRRELLELLSRSDIRLFLRVIQEAEGGEPNLMVGGCRAKNLKRHPGLTLPRKCFFPVKINGRWRYSTASGNYQITLTNWRRIAEFLGLRDFSVNSQMLAALELIRSGGFKSQKGFLHLVEGHVNKALCETTQPWATSSCSSLPGHPKINYARLADKIRRRNSDLARAPRQIAERYRATLLMRRQANRTRRV